MNRAYKRGFTVLKVQYRQWKKYQQNAPTQTHMQTTITNGEINLQTSNKHRNTDKQQIRSQQTKKHKQTTITHIGNKHRNTDKK